MFVDAGPGFRIFCDYTSRMLRVQTNAFAEHPRFRPQWDEVAQYGDFAVWNASEYAKKITNAEVQNSIDWFWLDLASDPPPKPQATPA